MGELNFPKHGPVAVQSETPMFLPQSRMETWFSGWHIAQPLALETPEALRYWQVESIQGAAGTVPAGELQAEQACEQFAEGKEKTH